MNWYTRTEDAEGVAMTFAVAPNQRWDPAVLRDDPLTLYREDGTTPAVVRVSGRGSVWMYAAAGANVAAMGSALVMMTLSPESSLCPQRREVESPRLPPWIKRTFPENVPCVILEFCPAGPMVIPTTDEVATEMRAIAQTACKNVSGVVLTGRGPTWGYAALAAGAVDSGVAWVCSYLPSEGTPILCWGRHQAGSLIEPPEGLLSALSHGREVNRGMTIGVIGDPNSGKSVFSMILERTFAAFGADDRYARRFDCDRASPTPYWYVRMPESPPELRTAAKQPWTSKMEQDIAKELETLRSWFAVVVADLPGGNHASDPPARVPSGREVIMKEIDRFVLVARNEDVVAGWREALRNHGLEDRLAAIIETTDPTAPLHLKRLASDSCRWSVQGLDRAKLPEIIRTAPTPPDSQWTELAKELANKLAGGPDGEP